MEKLEVSVGLIKRIIQDLIEHIAKHSEEINRVNHWPEDDADTGSNLLLTVLGASKNIEDGDYNSPEELVRDIDRGAVDKGPGNMGHIMAKWLPIFLFSLANQRMIVASTLAEAFNMAAEAAKTAVAKPRIEGTILAVINSARDAALSACKSQKDLDCLLKTVLSKAKEALEKTTEKLEDLLLEKRDEIGLEKIREYVKQKEVDAGGLGFVVVLESIQKTVLEG